MAVSPEDLAAGTLALQVFIKNSQYVEIIVHVAFGAIPSVLGIGAAGLLGSGVINTARDVMHSISLIRMVGPTMQLGGEVIGPLNRVRERITERWQQSNRGWVRGIGYVFGPDVWWRRRRRGNTQSKQDGQESGGGGGSPPSPPNIKTSDKKEEQVKNT